MYIEFSQDSIEFSSYDVLLQSLHLAYSAMKYGKHVICTESPQTAFKIIETMKDCEQTITFAFEKVKEKFPQIASLKEYLSIYVRIIPGNKIRITNNQIINVGIEQTLKEEFWRETCLLVENLIDEKAYHIILRCCNPLYQYVNWDPIPGGGTTTDVVLQSQIAKQRFVICLADSDRHSPDELLGPTAQKINSVPKSVFSTINFTHGLEIENLFFSKDFLSIINDGDFNARQQKILSVLSKAQLLDKQINLYYDIKKGYTYKQIKDNEYLLKCFCSEIIDCGENMETCACSNCTMILIDGLGKNYLSNIVNNTEITQKINNLYQNLPDYLKKEWIDISNLIFSWCCCYKNEALGI